MNIQFLTNEKGEKTRVLVFLQEWNKLFKEKEKLRQQLQAQLTQRFRKVLTNSERFKKGKLKTRSAKVILDKL